MPILKLISKLMSRAYIFQIIKYGIVGTIGTIINLSVLYVLTEYFKIYYIFSEIIGFLIGIVINYLINKRWTFKENIKSDIFLKYIKYTSICTFTLILNLIILFVLVEFFYIWYIFAELMAIVFCFLINFFGNKFLTFKDYNIEKHQ